MKRLSLCLVLTIFLIITIVNDGESKIAFAQTSDEPSTSVSDLMDETDFTELEKYFNSLDDEAQSLFGGSLTEFIGKIANGEFTLSFDEVINYALSSLGNTVKTLIPTLITIVVIAIISSLANALKGNFASSSIETVVNFSSVALISVISLFRVLKVVSSVTQTVQSMQKQMEIVFPLLFTFMSALGASGSIAVYQPAVAILTFSVTSLVSTITLPILLSTVALSIVGNLSSSVRLNATSKFLESVGKWVMYCSFFIFLAFLSVNGITAGVYDSVSVRSAKFALSKYVPVIGGYLSEGFNVILAGTVLLKNAVGLTAVILLFSSILPLIIEIILLSLMLKLAAALTEPFSDNKITAVLSSLSSSVGLMSAVILGVAFSYFIFLMLLIFSGNLVL